METPNDSMTFTFTTGLHARKVKVDNSDQIIEKARYVDVDPMHIHVKVGDTLVFNALDADLTIENWPTGAVTVHKNESQTLIVPLLADKTALQLKLTIDGEDPRGRPNDEDPDLIYDNRRP